MPPTGMGHRLERLADKMAERMVKMSDAIADGFIAPDERPPGTVKLTEDEQLQQYYAMTPEKWAAMEEQHGMEKVMDYSKAMTKLHTKKFGPIDPSKASTWIAPGNDADVMSSDAQPGGPPGGPPGTPGPAADPASIEAMMAPGPQGPPGLNPQMPPAQDPMAALGPVPAQPPLGPSGVNQQNVDAQANAIVQQVMQQVGAQ